MPGYPICSIGAARDPWWGRKGDGLVTVVPAERRPWLVGRLRALYGDQDLLVERYLTEHGLVLSPELIAEIGREPAGKDPIFRTAADCPVCGGAVDQFQVRTGSYRAETNEFQVIVRATGVSGYVGINPLIYEIHGCGECFFVSTVRSDFRSRSGNGKKTKFLVLRESTQMAFNTTRDVRAEMLEGMEPEWAFGRPRDLTCVIAAYETSVACDAVKIEHGFVGARLRLASDRFRLASLHEIANDDRSCTRALAAAVADMERAFMESDDPQHAAPAAYMTMAGAIRLGEKTLAAKYFQVLRDISQGPGTTAMADSSMRRWCTLGSNLWADWRDSGS